MTEEEGGLANDGVTTETKILGKFLGFYMKFFQNLRGLVRGLSSTELRKRGPRFAEEIEKGDKAWMGGLWT